MKRQLLRPSQIITTFGPGSVVDLPDDSVMIAGIEHWFDDHKPHRKILEPRLQVALAVQEFRTPPVGSYKSLDIPFVRFPRWRVCPRCGRLSARFRWPARDRDLPPVPRCDPCDSATYPARIVVACAKGHIADFPWQRWVHRVVPCEENLFLRGEGKSAALGDMRVECRCGRSRSLSGALGLDAMQDLGYSCRGRRPWLDDEREDCAEKVHPLQRGASNIYFSVLRSALSIPPWSDPLQAEVASWWGQFPEPPPRDQWDVIIRYRFPGHDARRVIECIERLYGLRGSRAPIRAEEYAVLDSDVAVTGSTHFEAHPQALSPGTAVSISRLVALPRLREIRALVGFTRIQPSEMDAAVETFVDQADLKVETAPLSARAQPWLPAVENLGEGIFLRLDLSRVEAWEAGEAVRVRARLVTHAYALWRQARGLQTDRDLRPRLILLHTLAHLLMRQMSLDCGYSSASLRERIYADERMAGLLVYTSSPDSDGSLGGLVRQAKSPARFDAVLHAALASARICSSDPLCREHDPGRTGVLNGAACHACVMVSETSCEFGNRLLDRQLVIDLPGESRRSGYCDFDTA